MGLFHGVLAQLQVRLVSAWMQALAAAVSASHDVHALLKYCWTVTVISGCESDSGNGCWVLQGSFGHIHHPGSLGHGSSQIPASKLTASPVWLHWLMGITVAGPCAKTCFVTRMLDKLQNVASNNTRNHAMHAKRAFKTIQ